jgi:hypothetical protein
MTLVRHGGWPGSPCLRCAVTSRNPITRAHLTNAQTRTAISTPRDASSAVCLCIGAGRTLRFERRRHFGSLCEPESRSSITVAVNTIRRVEACDLPTAASMNHDISHSKSTLAQLNLFSAASDARTFGADMRANRGSINSPATCQGGATASLSGNMLA